MDDKVNAFKQEIKQICKKYGFCIGHEDMYGGFMLKNSYDEKFMEWFMRARVDNAREQEEINRIL